MKALERNEFGGSEEGSDLVIAKNTILFKQAIGEPRTISMEYSLHFYIIPCESEGLQKIRTDLTYAASRMYLDCIEEEDSHADTIIQFTAAEVSAQPRIVGRQYLQAALAHFRCGVRRC